MNPIASRWLMRAGVGVGALCLGFSLWGQPSPPQQQADSREELIAHGDYLSHQVAMCVKCHSPRTERGEVKTGQEFEGAPIPVESPFRFQHWAMRAPRIAGLPGGWSEEALAHFLETGETPLRTEIRPPMPPFRMNSRDAAAVAAYLNSLE